MRIEILGAESLGVRGLSCVVEIRDRTVVIDPGLALGYRRHGLLPHPVQVAMGEQVRRRIIAALEDATDVVMSHFHGDHVPLPDANPFQLRAQHVAPSFQTTRLWVKGANRLSSSMAHRRASLAEVFGVELCSAEGQSDGTLTFSPPMPHGRPGTHLGTVMMTRIQAADTVFVHASDIQLLDSEAISLILDWEPDIALVGGPPLYLSKLSPESRKRAWSHAQRLAHHVDRLILDHHLLRSEAGLAWLERISSTTGRRVKCAADSAGQPRCLLEARRAEWYTRISVPEGWHAAYARGEADTLPYQEALSPWLGPGSGD